MRALILTILLLACAAAPAAEPARVQIDVVNDAHVPPQRLDPLLEQFRDWGARVYAHLQPRDPGPVGLVLTERAGPGLYIGDKVYIRPDDDEMLETWVHELAHHATGHDSSFLFKEGVAVHTLEKLFADERRVPGGWPNYGATSDDWVRLYAARGQLPALQVAVDWPGYQGQGPEQDYRSWQIYLIGGSFVGWMIRTQGMNDFKDQFLEERPRGDLDKLQRQWLDSIRSDAPLIDASALLPDGKRYRGFAQRLSAPSPASPGGR
ncbi:MAG TPA: hypothetical protein VM074_01760 [Solimonas sp.]|nr:hypothetical protein [Solimonas sp.]